MKIIFASHNENKIKEIRSILPPYIELLSLSDINCNEEIPETGKTLEENALLKARYVFEKYRCNVFSDDTGLEVEALQGEPGVYSARYAGNQKNSADNIALLLHKLSGISQRKAQFRTVIALYLNGESYLFEGKAEGEITTEVEGENGFGYDPIFRASGYEKTFAQMSLEEKNKISHRTKAFEQLVSFLKK